MRQLKCLILNPQLFIILILSTVVLVKTETEYFSSIAGLENLYETEMHLLQEMQNYLFNLQQHIDEMQSEITVIHQEHNKAVNDLNGYLNNPINAYRLIKRLYIDWPAFEEAVTVDDTRTNYLETLEVLKQNLSFPTQDDMVGSTLALVRLQETYQLDVSEVASGILNGVKYGSSMSWQDCYLVGEYLYAMQDYNHTIAWFQQSTKILMSSEFSANPVALEFIETIAEYYKTLGNYNRALELVKYVLEQDSQHQSTLETREYLEEKIKEGKLKGLMFQHTADTNNYHNTNEFKLYEEVCRGELKLSNQTQPAPKLICRYHTNNHPYSLLQLYKLEHLSLDPYIILIHDVISNHEMKLIKEQARPQMKRSTVYAANGIYTEVTSYRTSKTAWFKYDQHKYIQQWLQHVHHVTGLNIDHAEELQIANYGLGGHFEPHFDFFTEDLNINEKDGNRISTAMFYLEDVEEGGGTAFPFLNLLVKPLKGSMLFWHNLHASGDRDYRTKHAGCPVLKGSKWIANVWLRELDQFRARPCDLIRNHEISLAYKNYD